jgi:aspartate/methionine/tyrosine aminotransferase
VTVPYLNARLQPFGTTIFSEMSALAVATGAINLGQGFPDTDGPDEVKRAAIAAIERGDNQYPPGIGVPELRAAIAVHQQRFYGLTFDPDTEVLVTAGATEAIAASLLALCDSGDEVVTFEPYYENTAPDAILAGAELRYVSLRPPTWTFDVDELAAAFTDRTRAIVLTSPHNPTGKVFSLDELAVIARLCQEHDAIAITDEIYEHITYDGRTHIPLATLPGMRERTVTISALSKTYSVTGWRVGWAIASEPLMRGIRPTHDFLTVAAAAPLQIAGITALGLPADYYARIAKEYEERRVAMMGILDELGLEAAAPEGAYYVMADISSLGFGDDVAAARYLVEVAGVASVPGSSFVSRHEDGEHLLRFAFCKTLATLDEAADRLRRLRS